MEGRGANLADAGSRRVGIWTGGSVGFAHIMRRIESADERIYSHLPRPESGSLFAQTRNSHETLGLNQRDWSPAPAPPNLGLCAGQGPDGTLIDCPVNIPSPDNPSVPVTPPPACPAAHGPRGDTALDRLALLQSLTAALSGALTTAQVIEVMIERGVHAMNAVGGSIVLLNRDKDALEIVRATGYAASVLAKWQSFPLQTPVPLAEAVRTGRPVFIQSREELLRLYPHLQRDLAPDRQVWAALPLIVDGQAIGAMGLSLSDPHPLLEADQAFMMSLARQCALALERARLYEAERLARAEAEDAQQRLEFLAEASHVLSASLDTQITLATVARLVVPQMADWCAVDMLDDEGQIQLEALAHVDHDKVTWARELRKLYPPNPEVTCGVPNVLRTGRSEFYPEVPDAVLVAAASDERHLAILRAVGFKSVIIVPLMARGRTVGAISLVSAESGRRYDLTDLAFAEDLARRVALAVDNARLYHEAQEASRSKDQFLATLSHELRTPLTPVLAAASALEDADLPRALADSARMIRRNVELEARLIDDLLDLTQAEKGVLKLDISAVEVHDLLRRTVELCRSNLCEKGLDLSLLLDARQTHICADAPRLQQVFWNLLANAIKYTPKGGKITIRTRNPSGGESSSVSSLHVEIADTGIGIEPQQMQRLFRAFEQGERHVHRGFGGLGLGLAVGKALVEAHGGKLTAFSAGKNAGSTFTVRLPLSVPGPCSPQPTACCQRSTPLRILLVEDHEDTSRMMSRLLRRLGYEVHTAASLAEARTLHQRHCPDLLISDIGLPDGTGLDLMRELRGSSHPIVGIAISGLGMDTDIARSKEAGFIEHLTKPICFQKLEALIQKITLQGAPG